MAEACHRRCKGLGHQCAVWTVPPECSSVVSPTRPRGRSHGVASTTPVSSPSGRLYARAELYPQFAGRLRQLGARICIGQRQAYSIGWTLRSGHTELYLMAPQGVDRLGALTKQQIAHAENHPPGLLRFSPHRHEPYARVGGRLAVPSASATSFLWRLTKGFT